MDDQVSFIDPRDYARAEQKRAFASASTNLIALMEAVLRDDSRPQLEKIAHDFLRFNAHFMAAVQASGELIV